MAEAKFYYDQLMNEDLTTFSIYLYSNDDSGKFIDRSPKIGSTNTSGNITEVLRGIISQDASMGTQITWNGSPLNLSSAWANLAINLKSASRNLANAANNVNNALKQATGGNVLNWDQSAYYSINEFQKTFGGMTTSTPLTISSIILPYVDSDGTYKDVQSQLKLFLECMYPNQESEGDEKGSEGSDEKTNIFSKAFSREDENGNKKGFWDWLIGGAVTLLSGGLTWAKNLTDKFTESIFNDTDKYVLKLNPPHGYSGVPTNFIDDQWMPNTLAIRIGSRQLFNLLISTINITVSKELTYYNNNPSPTRAQIDLSFQPVTILKPTEIREYILSDMTAGQSSTTGV